MKRGVALAASLLAAFACQSRTGSGADGGDGPDSGTDVDSDVDSDSDADSDSDTDPDGGTDAGDEMITFERRFDWFYQPYRSASIETTADSGYLIAATRASVADAQHYVYLLKLDAHGETEWERLFDDGDPNSAWGLSATASGGFVVTGDGLYLLEVDSGGVETWSESYPADGYSVSGSSVIEDGAGGIIAAGSAQPTESPLYSPYVVKTDALGGEEWSVVIDADYNGYFHSSIQPATDGGYVFLAGYADLYKLDASGGAVWERSWVDSFFRQLRSVHVTSDGGYAIGGNYNDYEGGGEIGWSHYYLYLIKTDAAGEESWSRIYDEEPVEDYEGSQAASVRQTADGGYVLAGVTSSYGSGEEDALLFKTDADGDQLWLRTFGDVDFDRADCVRQTPDGGFVFVGWADAGEEGLQARLYVVKTDPEGLL